MNSLGGRKFTISVLVVLITAGLCLLSKVTDTVYASVILGTAGAFITGNVYQHVKGKTDETTTKTP